MATIQTDKDTYLAATRHAVKVTFSDHTFLENRLSSSTVHHASAAGVPFGYKRYAFGSGTLETSYFLYA